MSKKVALLVGGWSAERQVSLTKGKEVEKALRAGGYDVEVIDVKKDLTYLEQMLTPKPDVIFNNLHGKGGEDGTIQAVLEMLEIPYTHSGVTASAIGMDKPRCKTMARALGVRVADDMVVSMDEVLSGHVMAPPYVVKPPCEGSSVGVRLIMENENQPPLDAASWAFGEEVMVEQYIPGRELTVAVLDGKAQAVTEIISHTRFFDYEAKYHDTRTELVLPAQILIEVYKTALDFAERVYNGIGCAGLARCDFRYDDSKPGTEGLYFLEINTQPGLTAESIGPSQVIHNGMSFVELCSHLVETAKCHGLDSSQEEQHNQAFGKDAPGTSKQSA
ncbi:MAG: D-alanine--D-alanine ligase [Rhodospirillales bacterium]|nr:D-alanine--D-alanine ligase [Rhodospirillales bacterium]MCB9996687.1 D-alanine--D-alanine ligase [Rhodospirillales bacterium]